LKECESANQKVKSAAISLLKEMYSQLGPVFKAMTLSIKSESVRSVVDAIMDTTTYNQTSANQKRKKKFLFVNMSNEVNGSSDQDQPGFEVPKTDLMTVLSPNILTELVSDKNNPESSTIRIFSLSSFFIVRIRMVTKMHGRKEKLL
jgi:hypothetical protein